MKAKSLIVLLGLFGMAGLAGAADSDVFTFPAGIACEFDLQVEASGGKWHEKTFQDENGKAVRYLAAGTGTALVFTANGKSLSTKSNGFARHVTFNPDGSYSEADTGHNLVIFFPTDNPPGPSTRLIVGRITYAVGLDGVWTEQTVSGKVTDICAALSN